MNLYGQLSIATASEIFMNCNFTKVKFTAFHKYFKHSVDCKHINLMAERLYTSQRHLKTALDTVATFGTIDFNLERKNSVFNAWLVLILD